MIPALLAQAALHAIGAKPRASSPSAPAQAPVAATSQCRAAEGGGSIASDLGQLTTDALSMLGLGGSGSPTPRGSQAAQAYASSNRLAQQ